MSLLTIVILVLLLIAIAIFNRSALYVQSESRASTDTHIIVDLDNILVPLLDMETGQRGFLLTGNQSYLAPYEAGRIRIMVELLDLQRRLPKTATNTAFIRTLKFHITAKEKELQETILLRQEAGLSSSLKIVDTNAGKKQMDAIRREISAIKIIYVTKVDRARTLAQTQMNQTLIWLIVGCIVFIGFLIFAYRQLIRDLREKRDLTARLEQESSRDTLTRLPNRQYFIDFLHYSMETALREGEKLALFYLDLDGFKALNDSLGHVYGDKALQLVSQLFDETKREHDILARLDGDQFAILLSHIYNESEVVIFAQRLLDTFSFSEVQKLSPVLGVSIGISFFPSDARTLSDFMHTANEAMYRAKEAGGRQALFYNTPLNLELSREQHLRNTLASALDQGEFLVYYQPLVDGASKMIHGAEALVRWNHPEYGLLAPNEFLPIAERAGLLPRIAQTVISQSIFQLQQWQAVNTKLILSINLSAQDCSSPDVILSTLETALYDHHLRPEQVEIELTESSLMRPETDYVVNELHRFGFLLAIDDFGTGYASLSYLSRFPVQRIKIDRNFIMHLPFDEYNIRLVPAIVGMARNLGLQVTAEGIENEEQEKFLDSLHCDTLQGYRYSKPLPSSDFLELLRKNHGYLEMGTNDVRI